eukprot:749943-Prymnesium_polylepis.1
MWSSLLELLRPARATGSVDCRGLQVCTAVSGCGDQRQGDAITIRRQLPCKALGSPPTPMARPIQLQLPQRAGPARMQVAHLNGGGSPSASSPSCAILRTGKRTHAVETDLLSLMLSPSWDEMKAAIRQRLGIDLELFLVSRIGKYSAPTSLLITMSINLLNTAYNQALMIQRCREPRECSNLHPLASIGVS